MGLSVIVRVTLRDGTFHEDIGYGHCENYPNKASAFEKSKKEGTTDAMKRALRNFGNVLGNCIYDVPYITAVQKIKVEPRPFKVDDTLYRHKAYKDQPLEMPKTFPQTDSKFEPGADPGVEDDEYGFSDVDLEELMLGVGDTDGHPDMVEIPMDSSRSTGKSAPSHQSNYNNQQKNGSTANRSNGNVQTNQRQTPIENKPLPRPPVSAPNPSPNKLPQNPPQNQQPQTPKPFTRSTSVAANPPPQPNQPQQPIQPRKLNQPSRQGAPVVVPAIAANALPNPAPTSINSGPPRPVPITSDPDFAPPPGGISVGFFSGRAVQSLTQQNNDTEMGGMGMPAIPVVPDRSMAFNPHSESPSIRKTPGVDHSVTRPVKPGMVGDGGHGHGEVPESPSVAPGNKYAAPATRMGGNRGGFKKPTFTGKRPVTGNGEERVLQDNANLMQPPGRGASVEVKHEQQQQQAAGNVAKRPRLSGP